LINEALLSLDCGSALWLRDAVDRERAPVGGRGYLRGMPILAAYDDWWLASPRFRHFRAPPPDRTRWLGDRSLGWAFGSRAPSCIAPSRSPPSPTG